MQYLSQAVVKVSSFTDDARGSVHNTLQSVSDRLRGSGKVKYLLHAECDVKLCFLTHRLTRLSQRLATVVYFHSFHAAPIHSFHDVLYDTPKSLLKRHISHFDRFHLPPILFSPTRCASFTSATS